MTEMAKSLKETSMFTGTVHTTAARHPRGNAAAEPRLLGHAAARACAARAGVVLPASLLLGEL